MNRKRTKKAVQIELKFNCKFEGEKKSKADYKNTKHVKIFRK